MLLRYCKLVIHAECSKDNVEPYCFNGSHILNAKYSNTHYRWFRITFSPKFTFNVFLNAFIDIFCICSWNFLMQWWYLNINALGSLHRNTARQIFRGSSVSPESGGQLTLISTFYPLVHFYTLHSSPSVTVRIKILLTQPNR